MSSDECLSCTLDEQYYFPNRHLNEEDPPAPDTSPSEKATHLSEDDEDRLRIALCNLFSLRPVELLCIQAIMNNKSLTEFADDLTQLAVRLGRQISNDKNGRITRFHAFQIRKAVVAKAPQFRDALLTKGQRKPLR